MRVSRRNTPGTCAIVHDVRDTIVLELPAETRALAAQLAVEAAAEPDARGRRQRILEAYEAIIRVGAEALRKQGA